MTIVLIFIIYHMGGYTLTYKEKNLKEYQVQIKCQEHEK